MDALSNPTRNGSGAETFHAGGRLLAVLGGLGCLGVLLVAAMLDPAGDGHGTHTQLGMPACSWVLMWNFPCPTCGMTTAFAHATDGHLLRAFGTQPMGALLAMGLGVGFWAGIHVGVTGTRVLEVGSGLLRTRVVVACMLLFLAAWVYKMITWSA